jgi:hypothetical protein
MRYVAKKLDAHRFPGIRMTNGMSRELQEKADRIMRELRESLVPIKEEISILRKALDDKKSGTLK